MNKSTATCLLFLLSCACAHSQNPVKTDVPVKTDHGWKTSRVIATRYHSDRIGENIGFSFPLDVNNADRSEVSDLIENYGGGIFEGGGYSGAVAYVTFDGVKDAASADKKILEVLPPLTRLMTCMASSRAAKCVPEKPLNWKPKPECGDDGVSEGQFCGSSCQALICKSHHWVVDEQTTLTMREFAIKQEKHRADLVWAMRSRVLTPEEMEQVLQMGITVLIPSCLESVCSYNEADKQKEFDELLLQQFRLRLLAGSK